MRYIAMMCALIVTMMLLFILANPIRDKWLYSYIPKWVVGYFTGSTGMTIYHTIIYKWYKKEL
jgi:hypothetical protein